MACLIARKDSNPLRLVAGQFLASNQHGGTAGTLDGLHRGSPVDEAHLHMRDEGVGLVVGRRQRLAAGDVGAVRLPERRQHGHRVAVLHQRAQRAQEVDALRVRGEPGVPAPQRALSQAPCMQARSIGPQSKLHQGGGCSGVAGHAPLAHMRGAASNALLNPIS